MTKLLICVAGWALVVFAKVINNPYGYVFFGVTAMCCFSVALLRKDSE